MNLVKVAKEFGIFDVFLRYPLGFEKQQAALDEVAKTRPKDVRVQQFRYLLHTAWIPHNKDIVLYEAAPWGVDHFRKLPPSWWLSLINLFVIRYRFVIAAKKGAIALIRPEGLRTVFDDPAMIVDIDTQEVMADPSADYSVPYAVIVSTIHKWRTVAASILPQEDIRYLILYENLLVSRLLDAARRDAKPMASELVIDLIP